MTITEGDTVTWVNRDNANHQVSTRKGQFVSPILKPKQTLLVHVQGSGHVHVQGRAASEAHGKIVVKGLPPTLDARASAPIITYGTKATLSGVVSNHKAGEQVTIYYQPYPQPNLIQRATVLTATGGTFSFIVAPQILTTYQAAWKGAYATPTTVQVQPKLTLGRNNGWIIHASGGRSFAGRGGAVPAAEQRDRPVGDVEEGAC